MKRTLPLILLTLSACMHREPPLPAPIPAISGARHSIALSVQYIDFVQGTGKPFRPGACVYVNYTGWLTNGKEFDSSRDTMPNGKPKTPLSFAQSYRRVIPGWDYGFAGMRVGGQRRLIIPPQLAYGSSGSGTAVPPAATLIFDVELMAVADTIPRVRANPPAGGGRGGAQGPMCPTWSAVSGKDSSGSGRPMR